MVGSQVGDGGLAEDTLHGQRLRLALCILELNEERIEASSRNGPGEKDGVTGDIRD